MERIKEPCSMNIQPTPKHQIEGSNNKKFGSDLHRPDYPARGADNPAPSKNFLSVAAAYNLTDRGERPIQHDSCLSKTTTRGPRTPRTCKGKITS
jgi:hypothetical protein